MVVNILQINSRKMKCSLSLRFPRSQELQQEWVNRIHRSNFDVQNITRHTKVCSRHFRPIDFAPRAHDQPRRLKENASPSVFEDYPQYLQPNTKERPNFSGKKRNFAQSLCESPTKKAKIVEKEHSYGSKLTPNSENKILKKKLSTLKRKLRRKKAKIQNMSHLIKHLKAQNKISNEVGHLLEQEFSGLPLELIKNIRKNKNCPGKGSRYSEQVKQFAVTLYYHSAKAYNYVRKILYLPHSSSIRNWCSSVECKPGFLSEVLKALEKKREIGEISREVSLVIDGMSIRKQAQWDRREHKYTGFTDYGNAAAVECSEELASESVVFMVVGLSGPTWKSVVGYFLCDKMSGAILAQLTRTALNLLADAGFVSLSVVWDGTFVNQEAARCLGCKFGMEWDSIVSSFPHPTRGYLVNVIFDVCHMLKLLRNTL